MKILLVNTSDHTGGAAIATLRLLKALRKRGVDAKLLCRDHTLPYNYPHVISLKSTKWRKIKFILERLEIFFCNGLSKKGLFSVDQARFGNDITKLKEFKEADVIHLHWINQAMLSLKDISKILQSGKRIVWTMHDMWPFTGICHQADSCEKWKTSCNLCPMLQHPKCNDISVNTFARKKKTYTLGNMTLVGCSNWLTNLASQSPLLEGKKIVSIPNPIDTTYYVPAGSQNTPSQEEIRYKLGLPINKKLLLFAAFKVTDPNKGIDFLLESLSILISEKPELKKELSIVLAGQGAWTLREAFPISTFPMGNVTSEERMLQIYQAVDVLLMPTLMDNLPNTIVEAMACGVPCVAFSVGGITQMIDSGINGFLAPVRDSHSFARCIASTIYSTSYAALCNNARSKAVASYSEETIADKYIKIYQGESI